MHIQSGVENMLKEICNNKKTLRKLVKQGYLPYNTNPEFSGSIAIINDKAVLTYLQDTNDESRAIATTNFIDNGILIFKLDRGQCDETRVGWKNKGFGKFGRLCATHIYKFNRESVTSQIHSARRHCMEAKEKAELESSKSKISRLIEGVKTKKDKRLSEKEILFLIKETLEVLTRPREAQVQSQVNIKHFKNEKHNNVRLVSTDEKNSSPGIDFGDI
ncbi:MAG: hypothetical protein J6D03_05545 [Clostridia bacterium]|nr:hypothetical protein [Clostridia bacterium]